MEMKHTKGPWGYGSTTYSHSDTEIDILLGGKRAENWVKISGNNTEEVKANACLIAACPELLEACKEALEELATMEATLESEEIADKNDYFIPSKQLILKLEQVISKAEKGE